MILGIDFGGSKVAVGVVDQNDGTVWKRTVNPVNKDFETMYVLAMVVEMSRFFIEKYPTQISAIGIGTPGTLDYKKGWLIATQNLPKWKNVPVREIFENAFDLPVFFDNDARAAALGEWKFGTGKGTSNMIYLTVSTGIGGGIIVNNKIYRGRGNAGELGAMIIDMKSKTGSGFNLCGDLESLASGTAIAKKAGFKAEEVFQLSYLGDKTAKEASDKIINAALTALGIGLVNLVHAFDPEVIVLGGSVATNNQEMVFPFLRGFIERSVMPGFEGVKILPAKLGSDSGIVGAAVLAMEGGLQ